ncbi:hypothetical protein ACN6AT_03515 [Streptomyces sp. JL4002]
MAAVLGGVDLSLSAGMLVTASLYAALMRRSPTVVAARSGR